ncbi:MAG: hypothetical protein Kow00107_09990 [Planctomycetota bacterium]
MKRLAVSFIILCMLFALPFVFWGDYFEKVLGGSASLEFLNSIRSWGWLVAIGLLISDIILPVPATSVMGSLGSVYGPILGGLVGATGSILSGMTGYALCRLFGRTLAARFADDEELYTAQRFFDSSGAWAVALSRWLPILPEAVACLAGLSRMRLSVFSAALAAGSIPMAFTFAVIGTSAHEPLISAILCALLPLLIWLPLRKAFRLNKFSS